MSNNKKETTLKMVDELIKKSKPDLITVTGDWCYNLINNKKDAKKVFNIIEKHQIPWAPIFGNHDMEGTMSRFSYVSLFKEYENCLFRIGYTNIGGVGNYIINIREGDIKGRILQSVFMMDSNTASRRFAMEYQSMHKSQVEWYEWSVKGLNVLYQKQTDSEKMIPTLLFQHIPIYEAKFYGRDDVEIIQGKNNEPSSASADNIGMFDKIIELGSTKAVFYGHDHFNNSITKYKGVYLVYGAQSGWCKDYAEDGIKGGTEIVMDEYGNVEIEFLEYDLKN